MYLLSQLLSKITVASCRFYIKCSMCPPFCWTTLLKCVFTEVLFSIVSFQTDISQGRPSVVTHLRCGGIFSDSIVINVLLILRVK